MVHLANMHVFESFISWSLAAPSPSCALLSGQCSQTCHCHSGAFLCLRETSWCLQTLQDCWSRLPCSVLIMETLSQAFVRDHIKAIRWRLSATQIKHAAADKQMLTVSGSRHFPVCFPRCALLTTTSLGARSSCSLPCLLSVCPQSVRFTSISYSCSPTCGFSGSPHGSACAHRPQGRCKCLDCCEIAAPGAKLLPPGGQPVP